MLAERWTALLRTGEPGAVAAAYADVERRHREPHRRYHTLDHVGAVVAWVDRWADTVPDPDAVVLAAFLHDVVYDPRSATNEADSARTAATCCRRSGWGLTVSTKWPA